MAPMSDAASRAYAAGLPNPEFATTARTEPKALSEATVAIVTTAAIHHPGDEGFTFDDTGFRIIDQDRPEVVMGHWSPNFDHAGFAVDPEVVLPRARLA